MLIHQNCYELSQQFQSYICHYATEYIAHENKNKMRLTPTNLLFIISLSFLAQSDPITHMKECIIDQHTVITQTKFMNISIFVDGQDRGISTVIRQTGSYNVGIIELLRKYIFQEESIIHVGAHVGLQTLVMAKQVQSRGYKKVHIYAFEPNQLYYILLTKSLYLNNLNELATVYKVAAGSQSGQGQLAVKNLDTSSATIFMNTKTQRKADYKYNVQVQSIDKILQEQIQNNVKIGLVYISANTMEIQVLMGMRIILNANKQHIVIVCDWQWGRKPHKNVDAILQILRKFEQNKYRLFKMTSEANNTYEQIHNFDSILHISSAKLIFIPKGKNIPLQEIK